MPQQPETELAQAQAFARDLAEQVKQQQARVDMLFQERRREVFGASEALHALFEMQRVIEAHLENIRAGR
jgi:hypothetical protein